LGRGHPFVHFGLPLFSVGPHFFSLNQQDFCICIHSCYHLFSIGI
jgi:hypothetical protein